MNVSPRTLWSRVPTVLLACLVVALLGGCGAGGAGVSTGPASTVSTEAPTVTTPTAASSPSVASKTASSGRVLVRFRPGVPESRRQQLMTATGTRKSGEIHGTEVHVLTVPPGRDENEVAESLATMPEVKFAEADALVPLAMTAPRGTSRRSRRRAPGISRRAAVPSPSPSATPARTAPIPTSRPGWCRAGTSRRTAATPPTSTATARRPQARRARAATTAPA